MELKLEIDQLNMKREAQRINDRIWLEREKSLMSIRQLQAKQSASIVSNDAKSSRRVQEAKEKVEAGAKRRKATWFGSNMGTSLFEHIHHGHMKGSPAMLPGSSHYQGPSLPPGLPPSLHHHDMWQQNGGQNHNENKVPPHYRFPPPPPPM
mmetsp:Transcript_58626/g.69936  ORF Transcript_58626/g.69936 Transcript_58626/m.69936 type:complete len:151 (+) Transcript_58626:79-531(+)